MSLQNFCCRGRGSLQPARILHDTAVCSIGSIGNHMVSGTYDRRISAETTANPGNRLSLISFLQSGCFFIRGRKTLCKSSCRVIYVVFAAGLDKSSTGCISSFKLPRSNLYCKWH